MHPFALRRTRLIELMQTGIAIIPNATQPTRLDNFDAPYRADSTFFYLTGIHQPNTWLLLDADAQKSILLCHEKNPERELWIGEQLSPQEAIDQYGFDEAYPIEAISQYLPALLNKHHTIFWQIGKSNRLDAQIKNYLGKKWSKTTQKDLLPLISGMRLIKENQEIISLQSAGRITALAHKRAIKSVKPNQFEYQIQARLQYEFVNQGAQRLAYETIVASGKNACTLHYADNNAILKEGDLLLMDAGCEWEGYAGDITRTIPINGRFTPTQKTVYDIVLAAQLAAIAVIKPNSRCQDIGLAALKVLVQGMLDLKLLFGSVDGIIESQAYKAFYMHGIGHWLGLDVHDVGGTLQTQATLKPAMCLTVEPGLYIRPSDSVPEALHNIGIRIEDDVLVTPTGCHPYTADELPKTVSGIEELMYVG